MPGSTLLEKPYILGDHVCSIYQDRQQQFSTVIPFIHYGLEHNEKCIYAADDCTLNEILRAFETYGVPLQKYIDSQQMVFVTKKDSYLTDGIFDPAKTILLLKNLESASLKEGYHGLRGTGEMTWALDDPANSDKLIYYESQLNTFFQKSNITVICQYNEKRFDSHILTDIIRTHPKVHIYNQARDNQSFYTPPEYMSVSDRFSATAYKEMVKEIAG